MTKDVKTAPDAMHQKSSRSRLWVWFVAGFLVLFVARFFMTAYYYDGQALYGTTVWRYYQLEIRDAWNSTSTLGPTTGNSAIAVQAAIWHILFASVGGVVLLGFGWILQKMVRKR